MNAKLILASASARRKKILAALGVAFDVVIPEVEEVFYALEARRTIDSYTGSRTTIMGLPEKAVRVWFKKKGLMWPLTRSELNGNRDINFQ